MKIENNVGNTPDNSATTQTILKRLEEMEAAISRSLDDFGACLERRTGVLQVFEDGLTAYRHKCRCESAFTKDPVAIWRAAIAQDHHLRYPHRKILDRLLEQFDHGVCKFRPRRFSKLVTEAHVGKGRAGAYIRELTERGYVKDVRSGSARSIKMCHPQMSTD